MRSISYTIILLLGFGAAALGQDQTSNIVNFTPSALFKKGQFEVNAFHSLYTQTELRDRDGERIALDQRQSFLNGMYQFTYGASNNRRINVGLDVNVTRAVYDNSEGSPLQVFGSGDQARTIVSSIGPRIKFVPFAKIPRFSVQSTFLVPVANDQERPFFVAHDRYTWFTQLFFDKSIGEHFQVFTEASMLYRINNDSENDANFFRLPVSLFLSYFPTQQVSIFGFAQYSPRFEEVTNGFDSKFGLSQRFTQLGMGAKWQATQRLGLELSYGGFVDARLDGAGQVYNFAIRYIR